MMDKAKLFNNVGVSCFFSGFPEKATILFKGSLEVQLAIERCKESSTDMLYSTLANENPYVAQAQRILEKHSTCKMNTSSLKTIGSSLVAMIGTQGQQRENLYFETEGAYYKPYLFRRPFYIWYTWEDSARFNAVIIIFNLALMEQIYDRQSLQALSLYKLAVSLMIGQPLNYVFVALMNNIAMWYYQNDDFDSAQSFMGKLQKSWAFKTLSVDGLEPDECTAIQLNILRILSPQTTISPAA